MWLQRVIRAGYMDPAMAIAREQQVCPFAMQCLVGIPAKAFGQVGAIQLGALMQTVGQLQIGHRLGPQ